MGWEKGWRNHLDEMHLDMAQRNKGWLSEEEESRIADTGHIWFGLRGT